MSSNSTLAPAKASVAPSGLRRWQRKIARSFPLLLMALPGALTLFVFSYLPMPGIILAFKDFKAAQGIWGSTWVGLANFRFLFGTDTAWRIIRNTLFLNGMFIVVTLVVAVAMAVLGRELRRKHMAVKVAALRPRRRRVAGHALIHALMIVVCSLCLLPLLLILAASLTDEAALVEHGFQLIPAKWSV